MSKRFRSDQMAAAALGINIIRYKLAAFLISVTLASLAGSMYAFFFNFLSPEMVGTGRSLELVAMLIVGVESTLFGGLLGALLLTLLPTVFQPLAIYKTFAAGALLVASFLYLPQGIYGALIQIMTRLVRPHGEDLGRIADSIGRIIASTKMPAGIDAVVRGSVEAMHSSYQSFALG